MVHFFRLKSLFFLSLATLFLVGCAGWEAGDRKERIRSLEQQNQELKSKLAEIEKTRTRQEGQNLIISLQSRVLFDLAEYKLKPESKETLKKVADVIAQYPDRPVAVEGHTDAVPVKSTAPYPSNLHLSSYRAVSVAQYLAEEVGLKEDRLRVVGYGANQPLRPNTSPENRRLNRRVELVLYPPKLEQKTVDTG